MHETEHDNPEDQSKSQRKRELHELKMLGRALLEFSDDALRQLLMSDTLLNALRTAKRITSNSASKRQLQYIGKLLKDSDVSSLHAAVEARDHQHSTHTKAFQQLEVMREKLITEGDSALSEVLALYPHTDRQRLRKLMRQARKERQAEQPPRASRLLFRFLRELQETPEY